jgi:uncharacterized protein YcbX
MATMAGSVVSLWRYPVKSMMGEELNSSSIAERGLAGDRAYALIDPTDGKVVSAKQPRKWGRLFDFRAAFAEPPAVGKPAPPVWVTLPNGDRVRSDQREFDEILSGALERAVTLGATAPKNPTVEYLADPLAPVEAIADFPAAVAAPPGTFFDYAAIHVLTTATIERLREVYPQGRFEVRRFRPNIVVESPSDAKGFVENAWVGRILAIGDEIRLRITDPCPRCVMTTLPQGDLPRDLGILRAAADHNRVHVPVLNQQMPSVGVYAVVERGGRIQRGDPLRLEG